MGELAPLNIFNPAIFGLCGTLVSFQIRNSLRSPIFFVVKWNKSRSFNFMLAFFMYKSMICFLFFLNFENKPRLQEHNFFLEKFVGKYNE